MKRISLFITVFLVLALFCGCGEKPAETTLSDPQNGSNNAIMGGLSVLKDGMIYFVAEGENGGETISVMSENGENEAVLYAPADALTMLSDLNCDGQALYFMERIFDTETRTVIEERICRYHLQSGELTTLHSATDKAWTCITLHEDTLYFCENGFALMAMATNGSEAPQKLLDFRGVYFIIHNDRIWPVSDFYKPGIDIVSYDLSGGDEQVIHKGNTFVAIETIHNGRVYFNDYGIREGAVSKSIALDGSDEKKLSATFGYSCNPIGNTFYTAIEQNPEIASNSDLTVTPSTEELIQASPSDIRAETKDNATASDLVTEDRVPFAPGKLVIYVHELTAYGDLKRIDTKEYPSDNIFIQGLGCFSGEWRFYSIPEEGGGRSLHKEKM